MQALTYAGEGGPSWMDASWQRERADKQAARQEEAKWQPREMVADAPKLRAPTEAVKPNRSTLENW